MSKVKDPTLAHLFIPWLYSADIRRNVETEGTLANAMYNRYVGTPLEDLTIEFITEMYRYD